MGLGRVTFLAAAGVALAAAASQASGGEAAEPVYEYWCNARLTGLATPTDALEITKVFSDDGEAPKLSVNWTDHSGSLVPGGPDSGRAFASLKWPGDYYFPKNWSGGSKPLEWPKASFTVQHIGGEPTDTLNARAAKKEEWRQVIVDRDDEPTIHARGSMRTLWLNSFNLYLMSELEHPSGAAQLHMSAESLLAWGTGRDRLTVYEVGVTRRKKVPNSFPTSPAGQRRIIRSYQIDVPGLRRAVERVRTATLKWEAELGDYRSKCRRQEKVDQGDIILTGDPAR